MTDHKTLTFEEHRDRLRGVGYRMLGSLSDADDAVQEAWIRFDRAETGDVDNIGGWLTTVTARVCLNMLAARTRRGEVRVGEGRLPDMVIESEPGPEQEAMLSEAVGVGMMVVLDTLSPAERVAFVLHDIFSVPFDEIAALTGHTPAAARQLASRARRRVSLASTKPDPDLSRQRRVVDAFFKAARSGDFDALVATLDPDIVLQADLGVGRRTLTHGANAVAGRALMFADRSAQIQPALINGAAGVLIIRDGRVSTAMAFTIDGSKINRIDSLGDPERIASMTLWDEKT
jgi:RNA polymerase sigma-70 factor (ECF subfamily)